MIYGTNSYIPEYFLDIKPFSHFLHLHKSMKGDDKNEVQ